MYPYSRSSENSIWLWQRMRMAIPSMLQVIDKLLSIWNLLSAMDYHCARGTSCGTWLSNKCQNHQYEGCCCINQVQTPEQPSRKQHSTLWGSGLSSAADKHKEVKIARVIEDGVVHQTAPFLDAFEEDPPVFEFGEATVSEINESSDNLVQGIYCLRFTVSCKTFEKRVSSRRSSLNRAIGKFHQTVGNRNTTR